MDAQNWLATLKASGAAPLALAPGRGCSAGEVAGTAEALADRLRAAGLREGELLALELGEPANTTAAVLAAWLTGAVALPVRQADPRGRLAAEALGVRAWVSAAGTLRVTGTDAALNPARGSLLVVPRAVAPGLCELVGVPPAAVAALAAAAVWDEAKRALLFEDARADLTCALLLSAAARGGVVELCPADPRAKAGVAARAHATGADLIVAPLSALVSGLEPAESAGPGWLTWGAGRPRGPLPPLPAERHRNLFGDEVLFAVTALRADPRGGALLVHAGRPLRGLEASVVDGRGRPAPVNTVGEWRWPSGQVQQVSAPARSGATAAPLGSTGHRSRRRPDGTVEVLERCDGRLDVRGVVLDPRELARAFACARLGEAAAVVRGRGTSDERLVIFHTREPAASAAGVEALARFLPAEVHPPALVRLAALPRSSSGTVNAEALGAEVALDEVERGALERTLRQTLGVEAAVLEQELFPPAGPDLPLPSWQPGDRRAGAPPRPRSGRMSQSRGEALAIPDGSLGDALARAAAGDGSIGIVDAGGELHRVSYHQLRAEARALWSRLHAAGVRAGDQVLVVYEADTELFPALWAGLLGGVTVAPMSIPMGLNAPGAPLEKLEHAIRLLDRGHVLASGAMAAALRPWLEGRGLGQTRLHSITELPLVDLLPLPEVAGETPALILFTSGSTGAPKGVILTHRNILAMARGVREWFSLTPADVTLNWLPTDHSAGLVLFHLRDVWVGCSQVHAATSHVLADPLRWLDLMDAHRVTVTWAPNFAYGLVNERAADLARRRWDLSRVRIVNNGGERITPGTNQRFLELLARHGLPGDCIRPGFGMTETSSGIVFSSAFRAGSDSSVVWVEPGGAGTVVAPLPAGRGSAFVELGVPIAGAELRVVDDRGEVCPEWTVGHIQVRGPQITPGYFRNPAATAEAFTADGWLKMGDLGFFADGRLVMTGRQKEIVIVRGMNYACGAIEGVAERVPGVRAGHAVACGLRSEGEDSERLAIFFSPSEPTEAAARDCIPRIEAAVLDQLSVRPELVVAVPAEAIPRTSIGKLMRREVVARHARGELQPIATSTAAGGERADVVRQWLFAPEWRPRPVPVALPLSGAVLLLEPGGGTTPLAARLSGAGARVVRVHPSDRVARVGPETWACDLASAAQLEEVLRAARAANLAIQHAVHAGGLAEPGSLDGALRTVVSVHALLRAAGGEGLLRLTVVARGSVAVTGTERGVAAAGLHGLLQTARIEQPGLDCRHVDVDEDPPWDALVAEVARGDQEPVVAYRAGARLVPGLARRVMEPGCFERGPSFQAGGLYLLAGGLGGIGLHVAGWLADSYQARLVLVGRTPLPDRGADADPRRVRRGVAFERIRARAPSATYHLADATDGAALAEVIERAEHAAGRRVDGVLNLVGEGNLAEQLSSLDERSLLRCEPARLLQDLAPRARSSFAIDEALADRPGAAVITFSSVTGWFGGAGFGGYSAACSLQDAHAAWQAARGRRAQSLAWTTWRDTGMAEGTPAFVRQLSRARGFELLTWRQGVASLRAAVTFPDSRLLLGLWDQAGATRAMLEERPERRLTVYVAAPSPDPGRIREVLSGRDADVRAVTAIPRGPGGVPDRSALEHATLSGDGRATPAPAPLTPREARLLRVWREVLGRPEVSATDDFFAVGGDSILTMQLISRAAQVGFSFRARDVFEHRTVARLAALERAEATRAEQGEVGGDVPLTPIQRWFLDGDPEDPAGFTMSLELSLPAGTTGDAVRAAARALVSHHDALRLRFRKEPSGWRQWHGDPEGALAVTTVDLRGLSAAEAESRLRKTCEETRQGFRLESGPLASLVHARDDGRTGNRLVAIAHHLVVDGVSWRVLHQDLDALLGQAARGEALELPPKTTSFRAWAELLSARATSPELDAERSLWAKALARPWRRLPRDMAGDGPGRQADARVLSATIDGPVAEALLGQGRAGRRAEATVEEYLLGALAATLVSWSGGPAAVDVESHGREELERNVDLTRTVGWFTSMYPVVLDAGSNGTAGTAVRSVQRSLRAIPARGIGYGLLRHLSGPAATSELRRLGTPEVSFNYLGQMDGRAAGATVVRALGDTLDTFMSPVLRRGHLLDVAAVAVGQELHVTWQYSATAHAPSTIETQLASFQRHLADAVRGPLPPSGPEVDLLSMDSDELGGVLASVRFEE